MAGVGGRLELRAATEQDFESLLALRIAAMRPSLERIGRFDPQRARERLRASFDAAATRIVVVGGADIGFVAVKPLPGAAAGLLLDHLYLHPDWQGRQLGARVLQQVIAEADRAGLPLHVGALRGSAANRFYQRHGFVQSSESEWDIYYIRPAAPPTQPNRA
ncbi:GNAT family N-acetyltransferase [Undibacterium sp.]|jgi:GNAT superfamily N-acetyltransferase|uniref:GNAT family N-acetyltransferase n=1 Tax=Undibacterium sp. TaxID=1914977 RepID=UPI002CB6527E|nr:GNAT family N-acetyltransferase [Undibacterium sp.]HTD06724.1 GNAT family N-acetyltransferase [Undibacterium sp.]